MSAGEPETAADDLLLALQRLGRLMASRQVASRLAEVAGADLSQQGVRLVRTLHREGRLPIAAVAARSEMDLGAASRQLKALEAERLVRRGASPEDQRVALVELTDEGTLVATRLRQVGLRHLDDAIGTWSEADRRRVGELLTRLVEDLERTELGAGRPPPPERP